MHYFTFIFKVKFCYLKIMSFFVCKMQQKTIDTNLTSMLYYICNVTLHYYYFFL